MNFYNHIYLGALVLSAGLIGCSAKDGGYYEEEAVEALDLLTENMGELNSCSFTLSATEETLEDGQEWVSTNKETDAYINGADQMYFYTKSENGRRGFWINEGELSIFLFNENKYQIKQVPKNLLRTMDSINGNFKFNFPAADFFYPSLTDDLIAFSDSLFINEDKTIDGQVCKEIFAKGDGKEIFILMDAETNLPKQLEIYDFGAEGLEKSYVASFSNWKEDPKLPAKLFAFTPPENAVESEILKKK
jgi:hypothetical protein